MEVEITRKKDNALLDRTEVYFKVVHEKEKTPKRDAVRGKIAEALKTKRELVVVDYMRSEYGMPVTVGYAKAYGKKESLQAVERKHILKRNHSEEKKEDSGEEAS